MVSSARMSFKDSGEWEEFAMRVQDSRYRQFGYISETDWRIIVLNALSGNIVPYLLRLDSIYRNRYTKDVVVLVCNTIRTYIRITRLGDIGSRLNS
uniref:Uncharacterized protein n=1 Tax=Hyaloperonospora arabidopsidis (strain Emoy2) TaxID=559515 RepID=M4BXJ8_HYAAE